MSETYGRVPVWCPICDLVMKGDNGTYFKWGCCKICHVQFVEHREERWEAGWRPSADEVKAHVNRLGGFSRD